MFEGKSLRVSKLDTLANPADAGVYELVFDRKGEPVNKFDERTLAELREAVGLLAGLSDLRGVLVSSAKDTFIVGADITEFGKKFEQPAEVIASGVLADNEIFVAFEDLPVPSVTAINGFALGGGLEFALASSIRVMSTAARVGVPEVRLGLFPGLGGTARLSRTAGLGTACEWVSSGKAFKAEEALDAGVVDTVAAPESLRETALQWLAEAMSGNIDWSARQHRKLVAVSMPESERSLVIRAAGESLAATTAPHQPAAAMALKMMELAAGLERREALALEAEAFGRVACTQAAASLVQAFLNDQQLRKQIKRQMKGVAQHTGAVAVMGAGKVADEIVALSHRKGIRVHSAPGSVAIGQGEPTLEDANLALAVMSGNLEAHRSELAALESALHPGAVIASANPLFRLDELATRLTRPQDLVAIHFPGCMPNSQLIEIARASHTSDQTLAQAVAFAVSLGKTPLLVQDLPGLLVDRLWSVFVHNFLLLVAEGVAFGKIDQAMQAFGWAQGPAALIDLAGVDDTASLHALLASSYPARMAPLKNDALSTLAAVGRLGQKSGRGFYRYKPDAAGKPSVALASDIRMLMASARSPGLLVMKPADMTDRMLLPLIVEAAHVLEEGVVAAPAEVDTAMTLALGFPAYAGGPLQYADWLGLREVVRRCDQLRVFGGGYEATSRMRQMAAQDRGFYTADRAGSR